MNTIQKTLKIGFRKVGLGKPIPGFGKQETKNRRPLIGAHQETRNNKQETKSNQQSLRSNGLDFSSGEMTPLSYPKANGLI